MFMTIYQSLVNKMVTNPLALNYEKVLWKLHTLANLVLDLKLANKADLKKPHTIFQHIAVAHLAWNKVNLCDTSITKKIDLVPTIVARTSKGPHDHYACVSCEMATNQHQKG